MTEITREETVALVQTWKNRVEALGYKKGTRKYAHYEIEFFVGAIAALSAFGRSVPPIWPILIMSGRCLSQTLCPDKEVPHE